MNTHKLRIQYGIPEKNVMNKKTNVLVTGAGGFIGHHLTKYLKHKGYWVRGIDIEYPAFEKTSADEFLLRDLRDYRTCKEVIKDMDHVYALAADMGGMGYISKNHSMILRNNALINLNTLEAAKENHIQRYFFSSSACVYPEYKQTDTDIAPLKEEDAYPADPQDAYGWEKLLAEKACEYYGKENNISVRIARFHNVYGPFGAWQGGREKSPAALCRKIAHAKLTKNYEIEIWGDGKQTRSFCYIDDCIEGIYKIMYGPYSGPINLGQDRMISINDLADLIAGFAGIHIQKKHIEGPQGVRGRNSDNSLIKRLFNWYPSTSLEEGVRRTYEWIEKEVIRSRKKKPSS